MDDGFLFIEEFGDEVVINRAGREMLNIPATESVTRRFLKESLNFYPFELLATHAGSVREELRVGERVLHSLVSPVNGADGTRTGVVIVLRDFTELASVAKRQDEFVSVVSHELRTPLTSIAGALDIALSAYAGSADDRQRRYLKMARESCTRLNVIIDDLLDVARTEQGRMPIHFMPCSLDEIASDVVERYRAAAEAKSIGLTFATESRSVRISGDASRIAQVLNNLLSNALKFTASAGVIEVEVFGPSVTSNHVGISVYNNGESIPEEDHERIFEKFEQARDISHRRVGGSGLGLAISRGIVEAHGGRIWVENQKEGTKFVFTLPAAPGGRAGTSEDAAAWLSDAQTPLTTGKSVLIVDHDRYRAYILKGVLMTSGYSVSVEFSAEDALASARKRQPSLVVVNADIEDAVSLINVLSHDPDTRKAPILALCSETSPASPLRRAGADGVLNRPVEPDILLNSVGDLLDQASRSTAKRVLVVDDDPSIRMICREVLEMAGYVVRSAASGVAALTEARQFRPDLILLDVMMPDLDGFTTAEQMLADPDSGMTPIIFLSAKGETADKVRAFRLGAEDYMVKPFDAAELLARVKNAVARRDREVGASPTTRLPGADAIEREIEQRLATDHGTAFCYLDLDNLKAFNDYYGYAKADAIIRHTGDLIREVMASLGTSTDFIGHIAGDDFVFLTTPDRVDRICLTICERFDGLINFYYDQQDRVRGYIEAKDRYGEQRRFPIMRVSIAAVVDRGQGIETYSQMASAGALGKALAKTLGGSSYVRDERVVLGEEPTT